MYYKSDNHNWCRNHKVLSIRWCIHVCIQILWFTGMATGQPPCSRYTEGNTDNYGIDGNFTDRQSFNFWSRIRHSNWWLSLWLTHQWYFKVLSHCTSCAIYLLKRLFPCYVVLWLNLTMQHSVTFIHMQHLWYLYWGQRTWGYLISSKNNDHSSVLKVSWWLTSCYMY